MEQRLTILYAAGRDKHGFEQSRCLCVCGKELTARTYAVVDGQTRSCGCLKRESARRLITAHHKRNHTGLECQRMVFNSYRARARSKGVVFDVPREAFYDLIAQACFFCDALPNNVVETRAGETLYYNGVDRLDNTKGYVAGNCAACCKACNLMKKAMPLEIFLEQVLRIAQKYVRMVPR